MRVALSSFVVSAALTLAYVASADPTKQECVDANDAQQTLRAQNKLRGARDAARVCASQSCGRLSAECAQALYEIEHLIPTIVFEVKDAEGHDLVAVTVMMDGQKLSDRLDGTPLELEAGEHELTFEAGGRVVTRRVVILAGDKVRHERVTLEANQNPGSTTDVPPPSTKRTPRATKVPTADSGSPVTPTEAQNGMFKRLWLGVVGSIEATMIPGGTDVCILSQTTAMPPAPGYYCTVGDTDFPSRTSRTQNASIPKGKGGAVDGGPSTTAGRIG